MPDELVPQAAAPEAAPASTPASTPQAEPASLSQRIETATAGTDPSAPPTPSPQPPAPTTDWQGVRDYAKSQGVELPFEDDAAALQALLRSHQQSQQRDYYADLGRRVAPQADQIAAYLQQQQAQRTAPVAPPAWQGPEFKKEWLSLVERDENTGALRSKPGYDPAIAEKVQAYADWREKFLERPDEVIAPLIEERAKQLIEARFAEFSERTLADQIVARNAAWTFASDPQGQPIYTPQGQRQLTPEGVLYSRMADQLWRAGVRDVRQIDAMARTQVENAVMRQRLTQLAPAAVTTVDQAAPVTQSTSVGGQLTRPSGGQPAANGSQRGLSLQEMLRVNLERAGAPESLSLR